MERLTLEAVGRRLGLTRERIRQIEAKVLDKIRYIETSQESTSQGTLAEAYQERIRGVSQQPAKPIPELLNEKEIKAWIELFEGGAFLVWFNKPNETEFEFSENFGSKIYPCRIVYESQTSSALGKGNE